MSEATPKNIVRVALLSIWGMVTLVLVFVVCLLLYNGYQQDQDPLNFAEDVSSTTSRATVDPTLPVKTEEVALYFSSTTTTSLVPQLLNIELTNSTVENCRQALLSLIAGPTRSDLSPTLPPKTKIRAMYLRDNNELVIDFSRELEVGHLNSATADLLLVDSISKTLIQSVLNAQNDRTVQSIRFLFEGSPYQGTFPSHYDLSHPITLSSSSIAGNSLDAQ